MESSRIACIDNLYLDTIFLNFNSYLNRLFYDVCFCYYILCDIAFNFLCLTQLVSDLGQVGGFIRVLWFPPPLNNKRTATI